MTKSAERWADTIADRLALNHKQRQESRWRSVTKAVTWRFAGSIDTFVVSWLLTGQPHVAAGIASIEFFTKIALYYFHERAWHKINWGKS
jgi:uncharacterized membrane protein